MGADKVRLEVTLVDRRELDERDNTISAQVSNAWEEDGRKWLDVFTTNSSRFPGILSKRTICLEDYIVYSVTLYDDQFEQGYTEGFTSGERDQKEAFECLENICGESEVVTSFNIPKDAEDGRVSAKVGPKRIEITLRMTGGAGTEKKLVVTDVIGPSGFYNHYSVSGRTWNTARTKLDKQITTLWASSHWIAKVESYLAGGQGSAVDHFTSSDGDKAWVYIETMLLKFKPAEIAVITGWDACPADDDLDYASYGGEFFGPQYQSQHWTKGPSHYAPKTAYYRVAGDEVGAMLHREQRGAWEKAGGVPPEQSLKEMLRSSAEKKEDAGVGDESSSGGSQESDDRCSECGGTACSSAYCFEDDGIAGLGVPFIGGRSRRTLH
jgi:hypothetical protein